MKLSINHKYLTFVNACFFFISMIGGAELHAQIIQDYALFYDEDQTEPKVKGK